MHVGGKLLIGAVLRVYVLHLPQEGMLCSCCPLPLGVLGYHNREGSLLGHHLQLFEVMKLCGAVQRHLIPGLLTEHGLTPDQLAFPSDAITLIADGYTREVSHHTSRAKHLCEVQNGLL